MFYKSGTLYEIAELKDPKDLFELLIQPNIRGDYPYWSDIWDGFEYFKDIDVYRDSHKYQQSRFITEKHFVDLERFGIDYNHRDCMGNNFLQYVYNHMDSSSIYDKDSRAPVFQDSALTYITTKTEDIIGPNKYNRNVLFSLLSVRNGGFKGDKFFDFINKYPEIDIHAVDSSGRNLLFEAVLNRSPYPIINYLLENKVSLRQVNADNRNLLNMFISYGKTKENLNLFNTIFENVEDISLKPKFGGSFLETFVEIITDDSTNSDSIKTYKYWFKVALTKIIRGEFNITLPVLENTVKILEKCRSEYEDNCTPEEANHYRMAISALNSFILERTMPSKEGTVIKKAKI